jgi:transcriptional regulator with XRE-family HTH domain
MAYEDVNAVMIGKRIKELREGRKETMDDLSNAVDTSSSAIAMYETGKRIPRDEIKIRIAEHYGVPVESIFFQKKQHETCDNLKEGA